ncbi:MAG TPA: hypothetical protein VK707_10765 [Solirubrobacteraceae bacterium]|jgi:hypothetical protein|nr:hypothetical protein [Solirubrobacteraceae bacterium]
MKPIFKALMVAAALLLVGVPAASASTGLGWVVEGKRLHTGETKPLAETTNIRWELPRISWSGGGEVSCTAMKLKGAQLLGSGETEFAHAEVEHLVLSGCKEEQAAGCEVKPIETVPLKLLLETGVHVKFQPKEGEALATMTIAKRIGEACGLTGSYKLTGSLTAELPGAGSETVEQRLNFGRGDGLSVNGFGAFFTAGLSVELQSKQAWAVS